MNTEKIIKKQAKQSLRGNWSTVISAVLFVCALSMLLILTMNACFFGFKIVNYETNTVVQNKKIAFASVIAIFSVLGLLCTPLINGIYKMLYNVSLYNNADIGDLFYYFRGAVRYFKTVLLNVITLFVWGVVSYGLDCYYYISVFTDKSLQDNSGFDIITLVLAAALIVSVIIKIFAYLIFANYTLFAYAKSDDMPLSQYFFRMYGFALRHFKETLKLVAAFVGWIALCFFVVPLFYVLPYIMTSFATSAKWLFALEKDRGLLC